MTRTFFNVCSLMLNIGSSDADAIGLVPVQTPLGWRMLAGKATLGWLAEVSVCLLAAQERGALVDDTRGDALPISTFSEHSFVP